MKSFYNTNENFKQYVDRYCVKEEVSQEVAFTHSVVKNAYEYYTDAKSNKISVTEIVAGCGAASGGDCK